MRRWQAILALLLLAACACPSAPPPITDDGSWFVEVEGEGGYWVGPEMLQNVDIDPKQDILPLLRLSQTDQEIPYLPLNTEKGWGLFFFTADHSTRYTPKTTLRLEVNVPGKAMPTVEALPKAPTSDGLATLHWEENLRYFPQANTDVPWLWEPIYAPGTVTHTVTLPDALPGPITMTLRLWSHTSSRQANPDHLLHIAWDGKTVGEWEWDGQGMQHLTAAWEENQPDGEHTLTIETPAPLDVDVATIWLDGWDVTYRQRVKANGSIWQAEGGSLHVESAEAVARLIDVTDPYTPQDMGPVPADGIAGTVAGHRYWMGNPEKASEPLAIRSARQVNVGELEGVTYLALAPLEFHTALQPLLELRDAQGLVTALVDIQAVYDTFGSGQPDPEAIQVLVHSLPTLHYLLLAGDGTAEIGGYDGEAGALRVVAPLGRTTVVGETPADGLLGVDEEGKYTVAVGRFPAASADELCVMVGKTIAWENRAEPPAALVLSDDEQEFEIVAEEIAAFLPEGVSVRSLNAGDETSREDALTILKQGPTWLNYTGHGSLTILCDEGILTLEDGKTWGEPALVVAWTCLAAHYIHPAQDSIGEAWMRAPNSGAVAFLGPVGETTTGEQKPFIQAFYTAMKENERLGDGWLAALQAGDSHDVAVGYALLGDPALRVYQK
ncbi:MAG: C25 family cysteine peptidase [Anaerolineae bacterium]